MIYKDKSKEEIEAALEVHLTNFEQRIGFKPSEVELLDWAKQRLQEKIEESRESSFGHFSPKSLETLIKSLEYKINTPKSAPIDEFLVHSEPQNNKKKQPNKLK